MENSKKLNIVNIKENIFFENPISQYRFQTIHIGEGKRRYISIAKFYKSSNPEESGQWKPTRSSICMPVEAWKSFEANFQEFSKLVEESYSKENPSTTTLSTVPEEPNSADSVDGQSEHAACGGLWGMTNNQ